ncbi:MAG: YncE family protein [Acidimicrobiales bacterium]
MSRHRPLLVLGVALMGLGAGSIGSIPADAAAGLARIATITPTPFGLFDLTWAGTPFGKPTVFVADQSGIEAVNPRTDALIGTFGSTDFVPFGHGAAACGVIGGSGPNGVLSLTVGSSNQVWAWNGNSTVNVFTLSSPGSGTLAATVSTGGMCRADELSYDPANRVVLLANPTETVNYVSFISVNAQASRDKVVAKIVYPAAQGGLEQSVYDPSSGDFFLNVVQSGSNPDLGQIDVISPTSHKVVRSFPVAGCGPAGLALDPANHELLLGCGQANGVMIMDDRTGAILHTIPAVSRPDEVAFDPHTGDFVAPGRNPAGTPVLAVISARTGKVLATADLPVDGITHSVAASGGRAYVPAAGVGIEVFRIG